MKKDIALVLYYTRSNKVSFNVLLGSLEIDEYFDNLTVYFIDKEEQLLPDVGNILEIHEKVLICFSFFITQISLISHMVKELKEAYGNKPFYIAGGPHSTGDPKGTLKLGFDIAIIGEAEETFGEVLEKIDNEEDCREVRGIAFIDDNGNFQSSVRKKLADIDKYPPFSIKYGRCNSIEITRGCPFMCYFCQTSYIMGVKPRHRSVEKLCKYAALMKKHNLHDIRFLTPNALSYGSPDGRNIDLSRVENLLISIRDIVGDKGRIFIGSFPSEVRPEHLTKKAMDLILTYADNKQIVIGAQSGSQRILDLCHRGNKISDIYRSVELILDGGLTPVVDFIFGLPGEMEEDVNLTIQMIDRLSSIGAKIRAHTFIPLPQTPFSKTPYGGINENIKKVINRLNHRGTLFGLWQKQEEYSVKIKEIFCEK